MNPPSGERVVNYGKQLHRRRPLSFSQHRYAHVVTQVVHEKRQTVITLLLQLAPRAFERPQDLPGALVGCAIDQVLPCRVGHAVDGLVHAGAMQVFLEAFGAGVRLGLTEHGHRLERV